MKKVFPAVFLAACLALGGCSGSEDFSLGSGAAPFEGGSLVDGGSEFGAGTGGFTDPIPSEVTGVARYTFVPPRSTDERVFLAFEQASLRPIRKARVALLDEQDNVLSESVTAEDGSYRLANPTGAARVKVRIFSQTGGPGNQRIRVQDNTNQGLLYAADSAVEDLRQDPVIHLDLASGYDATGNVVVRQRPSGPFAVLDSILLVAERFGEDPASLPEVVVNWSINNSTAEGSTDRGAIGTSHFNGDVNALFILGRANNDTDEYDWHVMVHEFGHWYQFNVGRSESVGGDHSAGEVKDPRLAFGEGYGNALGGIVLEDSVYKDTSGKQSAQGFAEDLELNNAADSSTRGWYSEATVGYMVYDLFDPIDPREPSGFNDQLALPFSVLREGLLYQKSSPALATIFSFLEGIAPRAEPQSLASLLAFHTRNARFGINATDQFAVTETHDGGVPDSLPLYRDGDAVVNAGPQPLRVSGEIGNELTAFRFYRLSGTGQRVRVRVASPRGAVQVLEDGRLLGEPSQGAVFESKQGSTYVLVVGLAEEGTLNTTFTVSSP